MDGAVLQILLHKFLLHLMLDFSDESLVYEATITSAFETLV